jgi:hypothetical protein
MTALSDYDNSQIQSQLSDGINPAVIAEAIGQTEAYVRDLAQRMGWTITWDIA